MAVIVEIIKEGPSDKILCKKCNKYFENDGKNCICKKCKNINK